MKRPAADRSEPARTLVAFRSQAVMALAGTALAVGVVAGVAWLRPPAAPAGTDTVRIGVYPNLPKVGFDDAGNPTGLFIELIEAIADGEGWTPAFVSCAWSQCLQLLERGRIDLMPDVARTERRDQRFHFHAEPVAQSWSQLYTRAGDTIDEITDLDGLRVAVLQGSVQAAFLRDLRHDRDLDFRIIATTTFRDAFRRTAAGEADAAVANNYFGHANAPRFELVESPVTFNRVGLFFAAADGEQRRLPVIDRYLARWKADESSLYYAALVRANEPAARGLPPWAFRTLIGAVAVGAVLAGFVLLLRWRVRRVSRKLTEAHRRLEHLLASAPTVLYALRLPDFTVDWVSPNVERVTGFTVQEAMQPGWWERRIHPDDRDRVGITAEHLAERQARVQEYRVIDAAGRVRQIRDEQRMTRDAQGRDCIVGTWNDVTSEHEHAREVDYLANHDQLTGLPNRNRLEERLARIARGPARDARNRMVIALDLDRFQSINQSLGLAVGDDILVEMARRLRRWARRGDVVVRFGNDEFVIVTTRCESDGLDRFMDELQEAVSAPIAAGERELLVTASFGVARMGHEGDSGTLLLRRAQRAAQQARRAGGACWRLYQPGGSDDDDRRLFLESDLRTAVDKEEMRLYYQPQMFMDDRRMSGAEALIRWVHPERGVLTPDHFIPLAEETGIIELIDLWVIRDACRQLAEWDRRGLDVPRVSVNLSAHHLHSAALPEYLRERAAEFGVQPSRLMLEVTETQLMSQPERAAETLRTIRSLGFGVAVDDFGVGYSNLAYLKRLPVRQLKLDRTLIADLETSPESRTLVRGIVGMVVELGLELVAEGIETEREWSLLREAGCSQGQGFLIGRPAPVDVFEQWVLETAP